MHVQLIHSRFRSSCYLLVSTTTILDRGVRLSFTRRYETERDISSRREGLWSPCNFTSLFCLVRAFNPPSTPTVLDPSSLLTSECLRAIGDIVLFSIFTLTSPSAWHFRFSYDVSHSISCSFLPHIRVVHLYRQSGTVGIFIAYVTKI